ncbi:crotonase/enoyl-CoA hydratase family protein [Pyruvatibacter sp.]|uniref:crotonase/enoyl-CoA hydratase family protein n=1 Tax=Pyruvatibacter sp. TaxID=1981328 RepID=UPI00326395E3
MTESAPADAATQPVIVEKDGPVTIITIDRPQARNAVDRPTADALAAAFLAFEHDETASVAVFTGARGTFCAGADLKAVAGDDTSRSNQGVFPKTGIVADPLADDGPMGPSRMLLSKPVIAAVEGHAVAGGLELACWADMRVASESAIFGVFCRRWGVPLIDGGTVRLPRIIGHGRAMDLILTGRPVDAREALQLGLANRVVPEGEARAEAIKIAQQLAKFPQGCMRGDRMSAYMQWDMPYDQAMANEFRLGRVTLASGATREGAARFAAGKGRGGNFDDI